MSSVALVPAPAPIPVRSPTITPKPYEGFPWPDYPKPAFSPPFYPPGPGIEPIIPNGFSDPFESIPAEFDPNIYTGTTPPTSDPNWEHPAPDPDSQAPDSGIPGAKYRLRLGYSWVNSSGTTIGGYEFTPLVEAPFGKPYFKSNPGLPYIQDARGEIEAWGDVHPSVSNYGSLVQDEDIWIISAELEIPPPEGMPAPPTDPPSRRAPPPIRPGDSSPEIIPINRPDKNKPLPGFTWPPTPGGEPVTPPSLEPPAALENPKIPDFPPPLPDAPSRRRRLPPYTPAKLPTLPPAAWEPIIGDTGQLLEPSPTGKPPTRRITKTPDCCAVPEVKRQHEKTRDLIEDLLEMLDCESSPSIEESGNIAAVACDPSDGLSSQLLPFSDIPEGLLLLSQEMANFRIQMGLCSFDAEQVAPTVIASGTMSDGDAVQYIPISNDVRHVELIITGTIPSSVRTMRGWGSDEQQGKYGLISTCYPGAAGGYTHERPYNWAWTRRTGLNVGEPIKQGRGVRVFLRPGLSWVLYDTGVR